MNERTGENHDARDADPRLRSLACVIIILFSANFLVWGLFQPLWQALKPEATHGNDFVGLYYGGKDLIEGKFVYDRFDRFFYPPEKRTGGASFCNLPPLAFLMAPFAALPYHAARISFLIFKILLLLLSLYLFMKTLAGKPTLPDFAAAALLAGTFNPLFHDLEIGQSNVIMLFLLVLMYRAYLGGKIFLSALALAGAIEMKLFPALFLLLFLVRRDFRFILHCALSLALINLLTLALAGADEFVYFFTKVLPVYGKLESTRAIMGNQTLRGALERLLNLNPNNDPLIFAPRLVAPLHIAASAALVAVSSALCARFPRRTTPPFGISLALFFPLALIVIPHGETHYFTILLLPLLILLTDRAAGTDPRRRTWFLLAFASYYLFGFPLRFTGYFKTGPLTLLSSTMFFGLAAFWLALAFILRRRTQPPDERNPETLHGTDG
ncbi:MAG: glycosyltransferase family 87 protein [bacterium]